MVADPPEDHLRRHALVDLVQQLFDEPSACFSGHKPERAAAVKLPFRGAKPTPHHRVPEMNGIDHHGSVVLPVTTEHHRSNP
jgi:hypothetical protein